MSTEHDGGNVSDARLGTEHDGGNVSDDHLGMKHDEGKPPLALLPPDAVVEVARVLGHGARRYGAFNWRKGLSFERLMSAALRHQFAFLAGEDLDVESRLHHLAHAVCELLFVMQLQMDGRHELDDRWRAGDDSD